MIGQIIDCSAMFGRRYIINRYADDGLTIPTPPNRRSIRIQYMMASGTVWQPKPVRKSLLQRIRKIIRVIGVVALVTAAAPAIANDQQVLGGSYVTHVNRPVSITIVKTESELREVCNLEFDKSLYGCASSTSGVGRCVVYIRRDRLAWLYHELQHCAGVRHE